MTKSDLSRYKKCQDILSFIDDLYAFNGDISFEESHQHRRQNKAIQKASLI